MSPVATHSCGHCLTKLTAAERAAALIHAGQRPKIDPTRTLTLRRVFMAEMTRRWTAHKRDIRTSIVDRDCFGIQRGLQAFSATTPGQFQGFGTAPAKAAAFMEWLRGQEAQGILQVLRRRDVISATQEPWTNMFIRSAYAEKGILSARAKLRQAGFHVPPLDYMSGGLAAVIAQPIHVERVAAIYMRTFEDLKTVTVVTNARIQASLVEGLSEGLARGLAEGKSQEAIARALYKDVAHHIDKVGITRCRTIARTEVAAAHHKATMGEYRLAGVEGVTIEVEWLTGAEPCPLCYDLWNDGPYTLDEAEGMIPAHPNCICSTRPRVKKVQGRDIEDIVGRDPWTPLPVQPRKPRRPKPRAK